MKQKLFTLLFAFVASVSIAKADKVQIGDLYYNLNVEKGTASVAAQNTCKATIHIPAIVEYEGNTFRVIGIEGYAFNGCKSLTTITIPNGVTYIGMAAFDGCTNLTSITMPENNVSFYEDGNAFRNCTRLPVIDNIRYAGTYLVEAVDKTLTTYTIQDGTRFIGGSAFSGCTNLESITLPNGIIQIDMAAFSKCSQLRSINIPNSVTRIANYAFNECNSLPVIDYIRYADTYLVEVDDQDQPSYTIKDGTKWIATNAFSGCTNTTAITLPNSIIKIESSAFRNCSKLNTINFPNSVRSVADGIFYGCKSLPVIDNIRYADTYLVEVTDKNQTSYTIQDGTRWIGSYAFNGCNNLKDLSLPCSIQYIGYAAFPSTTNVTRDCGTKYGETTKTLCEDESVYWECVSIKNAKPSDSGDFECALKTDLYDDSIATLHLKVTPKYDIVLKDTFLCDDEDLIIDGVTCPLTKYTNVGQRWTRNLKTIDGCDSIVSITVVWKKLPDFTITVKDVYDTPNSGSISYRMSRDTYYPGNYYYTLNGEKNASLDRLAHGTYRLVFRSENCEDSVVKTVTVNRYGMAINNMYYLLDDQRHTATLTFRGTADDDYSNEYAGDIVIPQSVTFEEQEYQVTGINPYTFSGCRNIHSVTMESENPITIPAAQSALDESGLSNSCPIYVPFGALNTYYSYSYWWQYSLHVIHAEHSTAQCGATSASISFGDADEQKHIVSCGMDGGEAVLGHSIEYIGLEPGSEYKDVPFFVNTREGDSETIRVSFSTSALTLNTHNCKPVSSNTAILLAETNMADIEINCGFEWKRNDAPADMEGTKVYAPVANGTMAGRLKGLKDDVYYKYRAFYQSAAGNMYYGDWKYIFTGDVAVDFDPVMYTYPAIGITESEAILKGYALAGASDFDEQGFEYWADSRVPHPDNAPRKTKAELGEHHQVQADGISMRVTLTDLDAGTVYKYCTYAKTGDNVVYGAVMSFTTLGEYVEPTAIESIQPSDVRSQKILRNGHLFILRGGNTYTVTGQEVK